MHSSNQRPALRGDGRLGVAALTRAAYAGADIDELAASLLAQLELYPDDFSILMDLSVVEQLRGNLEFGLELQDAALKHDPLVETACALPPALNVLVLAAPIRMGGNTPVDFLVDGAPIRLTTLFVGPDLPFPDRLPPHDLAFVAAPGDSDESRHYLSEIERRLPGWPVPVLNQPESIRKLERDRVAAELEGVPGLVLARTERCSRETLRELGTGRRNVADLMPGIEFPLIVRPVGSHAGRDLERLSHPSEIPAYLAGCADEEFFLSDYIDYRSADGAFRKYRIVFIDGRPMPCHMAIADMWKVWYMNAEMSNSAAKRAEEERFFASFDHDFRARHAETFAAMTSRFGLEYFGIDCAEDRDGNLVLFEADSALIVHDMDSEEIFSYKKAPMKRVFAAFSDMLRRKVVRRRQPVEKLRAS